MYSSQVLSWASLTKRWQRRAWGTVLDTHQDVGRNLQMTGKVIFYFSYMFFSLTNKPVPYFFIKHKASKFLLMFTRLSILPWSLYELGLLNHKMVVQLEIAKLWNFSNRMTKSHKVKLYLHMTIYMCKSKSRKTNYHKLNWLKRNQCILRLYVLKNHRNKIAIKKLWVKIKQDICIMLPPTVKDHTWRTAKHRSSSSAFKAHKPNLEASEHQITRVSFATAWAFSNGRA